MSVFRDNKCFFNSKNLLIFATVVILPVVILAGVLTGCGNNQVDEPMYVGTVQSEDSSATNNDESIVSSLDRFVLDETEWPWAEDFDPKYPEYAYFISWYGDPKENIGNKEYYGIGYYLERKQDPNEYASIYVAPSFSTEIIGEWHSEEKVSCWPEKYQTENATMYGYYYLWEEGCFWHLVQFTNNNGATMFGWVAENEFVSLKDEYMLLYKITANDDDIEDEPIIYDWRSIDAYDDQWWIWESDFVLKSPAHADSIYWRGKLKGTMGGGFGGYICLKSGVEEPVKIHMEPSFSAQVVGELCNGEAVSEWLEQYQTEHTIVHGFYRVRNEGFYWGLYELFNNDNSSHEIGWIAHDESVLEFIGI